MPASACFQCCTAYGMPPRRRFHIQKPMPSPKMQPSSNIMIPRAAMEPGERHSYHKLLFRESSILGFSSILFTLNTLRPGQNGCHFPDNIFKCISMNENIWISIKISLKVVSEVPINDIPALVQIMAWHRPGDKPLSESMLVSLLTYICITGPQWVKTIQYVNP